MTTATMIAAESAALLRDSQARFEQMQEADRERAQRRVQSGGLAVLSDYERGLLNLPSREEQARREKHAADETRARRADVARVLRPADIVFRSALLDELNDHAIDLCVRHHITARAQYDGGGAAYRETRMISVPPVTNEQNYAVVLHEIGHVVHLDADSRQHRYVIRAFSEGGEQYMLAPLGESAAWEWAAQHAKQWTRQMHDRLEGSLCGYAKEATDDERPVLARVVRASALRVSDRPVTFAHLEKACAQIERHAVVTPSPSTATPSDVMELRHELAVVHEDIAELKQRPIGALDAGVYRADREYTKGEGVSHKGSFWVAQDVVKGITPGDGATPWRLAVKAGRDGRDART